MRIKTTLKGENASMVIQTLKAEHASFIQHLIELTVVRCGCPHS